MVMDVSSFATYPMGPALRHYLGMDEAIYKGDGAPIPGEDRLRELKGFLSSYIEDHDVHSKAEFIELVQDLTTMGLTGLVPELLRYHSEQFDEQDPHHLISVGTALFVEREFDEARFFLEQAHERLPDEPSVLVNLAQLCYCIHEDERARSWAQAGLNLAPNHEKLWLLMGALLQESHGASAGEKIRELATQMDSYMGLSLAAQLINDRDPMLKVELLADLYGSGLRDTDFLTEYTAALGAAGDFEKIPPIVWAASAVSSSLPWKLKLHGAQAYLAMEQTEAAGGWIEELKAHPDVPSDVKMELGMIHSQDTEG